MLGVTVHYLRGDWATTDDYIERILAMASGHGFAVQVVWMALRGDVQRRRDDTLAGMSNLQEFLRRLREDAMSIYTPWPTCCLAEGLADSQRSNRRGLLNDFNPDPHPSPMSTCRSFSVSRRDPGAIRRHVCRGRAFQASLDMADAQGALSWRLRTVSSPARLRLEQGACRKPGNSWPGHMGGSRRASTVHLRTARALLAEIDAWGAPPRRPEPSRRFTEFTRLDYDLHSPGNAGSAILAPARAPLCETLIRGIADDRTRENEETDRRRARRLQDRQGNPPLLGPSCTAGSLSARRGPLAARRGSDLLRLKQAFLARRRDFEAAINADFGHRSASDSAIMEVMPTVRASTIFQEPAALDAPTHTYT